MTRRAADRTTRDHDPEERLDPRAGAGRLRAAWLLVLVAPLSAEVAFSGISLPLILITFPVLIPMYGAGVLLVREIARRARLGWPGLLVLALAFEIAEDGLGLRALTSPELYTAADWGARVAGVNLAYWQSQIGYHLVFSVLIPVLIVDLVFPRLRRRAYLGPVGTAVAALAFVAGLLLVRTAIATSEDPNYTASTAATLAPVAGAAVLVALAVLVLPRMRLFARAERPVARALPPVPVMVAVAGVAPAVFMGLLFPLEADAGHPALGHDALVLPAMTAALAVAVGAGWLVARWVATAAFTDRHRVVLVTAALVGHSLLALAMGLASGYGVLSVAAAVVVIAATLWLMRRLALRVRDREAATPA